MTWILTMKAFNVPLSMYEQCTLTQNVYYSVASALGGIL